MLAEPTYQSTSELPLDFTQFLSERLSLEPPATLAVLGTFLLSFEPTGTSRLNPSPSAATPDPHT